MIHGKLIKVCGMREAENIQEVDTIQEVDMMGFIFYPQSPRYICQPPAYLPLHAERVGVFVNEELQTVGMYVRRFGLDYVQLHGNESAEYCRLLHRAGIKIIKAFSLAQPDDLMQVPSYEKMCSLLLFDTQCKQHGGSGKQFDWNILQHYKGNIPFLLSGGIAPQSVSVLKEFEHPLLAGYDLNSCFESEPGKKNIEQIQTFLQELKS